MLLLKRAKNGLSHFLLQAHTSCMWAFKSTLWYLFKIGFLLLNCVMESIRDNIFQPNALHLGLLGFLLWSSLCAPFLLCMPLRVATTLKNSFPQNSDYKMNVLSLPRFLTKVSFSFSSLLPPTSK